MKTKINFHTNKNPNQINHLVTQISLLNRFVSYAFYCRKWRNVEPRNPPKSNKTVAHIHRNRKQSSILPLLFLDPSVFIPNHCKCIDRQRSGCFPIHISLLNTAYKPLDCQSQRLVFVFVFSRRRHPTPLSRMALTPTPTPPPHLRPPKQMNFTTLLIVVPLEEHHLGLITKRNKHESSQHLFFTWYV